MTLEEIDSYLQHPISISLKKAIKELKEQYREDSIDIIGNPEKTMRDVDQSYGRYSMLEYLYVQLEERCLADLFNDLGFLKEVEDGSSEES